MRAPSDPPKPEPLSQPAPVAIDPLDATQIAFALYDRAAAQLRESRPFEAVATLRDGARRLPPPYLYEAEYLAELLDSTTHPLPAADLAGREQRHRTLADVRASLGDFRSAAHEYWTISEFDPVRFAASSRDLDTLRTFLVWSECSDEELRRLVQLAIGVPFPRSGRQSDNKYRYWEGEFNFDCGRVAALKSTDTERRIQTVLDYAHLDDESPFRPKYLLRNLLATRRLSLPPARKQHIYRQIGELLQQEDDAAGDRAWTRLAEQPDPRNIDPSSKGLVALAHETYRKGDYAAALALDRRVVALGPNDPLYGTALFNCGVCLDELGHPDEAVATFQTLIGSDVNDAEPTGSIMRPHQKYRSAAAKRLAQIEMHRGNYDRAIHWLVRGQFDFHVPFGCGSCVWYGTLNFLETWTQCLIARHRTEADLRAALSIVLDQGGRTRSARLLVDHYRRTGRLDSLRAELDRTFGDYERRKRSLPSGSWVIDTLPGFLPHNPRSYFTDPNVYLEGLEKFRNDPMSREQREAVDVLRDLTMLAQWRSNGDVESLWNYCRHYRLAHLMNFTDNYGLDAWRVRLAMSSILEMPEPASAWLKQHRPANAAEARYEEGWLLLLKTRFDPQAARHELERLICNATAAADAAKPRRPPENPLLYEAAYASQYLPDDQRGSLLARTRLLRHHLKESYPDLDFGYPDIDRRLDLRFLYE
jgi:tetratricopeptide (TPR) repeat protein